MAIFEKNRLEEKQRAVRRYREHLNTEHIPYYFVESPIDEDSQQPYWQYNQRYFEEDRPKKDWHRLLDIYSNELPQEIQDFIDTNR